MQRKWLITSTYALAHFTVDLACAFAIFSGYEGAAVGFLLYNFCAFALQMPMGILADQHENDGNWRMALGGICLIAFVILYPLIDSIFYHGRPFLEGITSAKVLWLRNYGLFNCLLLGIGNGLFHVGGGLDVLNLSGQKASPLGIFVSPGALGLYLGTMMGKMSAGNYFVNSPNPLIRTEICYVQQSAVMIRPLSVLVVLWLSISGMLIFVLCRELAVANDSYSLPEKSAIIPAFLCFLVVILRSFAGLQASFPWKSGFLTLAAVAVVVLGKAVGGILADHLGINLTSILSLSIAAVLFAFSNHAIAGLLALLFFNMTMPITLSILAIKMPASKGFSFGLLTFALFLGYLPSYYGAAAIDGLTCTLISGLSVLLLTVASVLTVPVPLGTPGKSVPTVPVPLGTPGKSVPTVPVPLGTLPSNPNYAGLRHYPDLKYVNDHPNVYFCSHPQDFDAHFESISNNLRFDHPELLIWTANDPHDLCEELAQDLSCMNFVVVAVTAKLLYTDNPAKDLLRLAQSLNLPIMPIMMEAGLEADFDRIIGNIQFLQESDPAAAQIGVHEKMNIFLHGLLNSQASYSALEDFDKNIFVSYRKADRALVRAQLKRFHENPLLINTAFWYDEYLTPGEDYNAEIGEQLARCDLFLMIASKKLLELPNYVVNEELSQALVLEREGKLKILTLELEPIDEELAALKKAVNYEHNPLTDHSISQHDPKVIAFIMELDRRIKPEELDRLPELLGIQEEPKLSSDELIRLAKAYLNGFGAERDLQKAIALLEQSAEIGNLDAYEALISIYDDYSDIALMKENLTKYLQVLDSQKDNLELNHYNTETLNDTPNCSLKDISKRRYKTLTILGNLENKNPGKAIPFYQQALEAAELLDRTYIEDALLALADAYKNDGQYEEAQLAYCKIINKNSEVPEQTKNNSPTDSAGESQVSHSTDLAGESQASHSTDLAGESQNSQPTDESRNAFYAQIYSRLGEIAEAKGQGSVASEYYQKGIDLLKNLSEKIDSEKNHLRYAHALSSYAHYLDKHGWVKEAADSFSKAAKEAKAILDYQISEENLMRALIYNCEVVRCQCKLGDLKGAQKNLRHLEQMSYFENTTNPHFMRNMATYYTMRGDISLKLSLPKDAKKQYEKALKNMEMACQTCNNMDYLNTLGLCYERMGIVTKQSGDKKKAIELFKKEISVLEDYESDLNLALTLENARFNLADCYFEMEADQEAYPLFAQLSTSTLRLLPQGRTKDLERYLGVMVRLADIRTRAKDYRHAVRILETGYKIMEQYEAGFPELFSEEKIKAFPNAIFGQSRKKPAKKADRSQARHQTDAELADDSHTDYGFLLIKATLLWKMRDVYEKLQNVLKEKDICPQAIDAYEKVFEKVRDEQNYNDLRLLVFRYGDLVKITEGRLQARSWYEKLKELQQYEKTCSHNHVLNLGMETALEGRFTECELAAGNLEEANRHLDLFLKDLDKLQVYRHDEISEDSRINLDEFYTYAEDLKHECKRKD